MSQETSSWLNENVLIGFTEKRGNAWHYREGADNHYTGAIPVADVLKRLFYWQAIECPVVVKTPMGDAVQDDRKAIVRNDNFQVLGMFKQGYQPHQYNEWLLENVANILDDTLAIGSAGLLRGGAMAWVQVEVPENITTPEGVVFRPNLTACTSFDGSLATTYQRMVTNIVCDNTMQAGLRENTTKVKIRHSRNSLLKIQSAREALDVVYQTADDFAAEVAQLANITVSEAAWERVLQAVAPVSEKGTTRGNTNSEQKRAQLTALYENDERCKPWNGTAWGVLQTFNTYEHHVKAARKATFRPERNMTEALTGGIFLAENEAMKVLVGA